MAFVLIAALGVVGAWFLVSWLVTPPQTAVSSTPSLPPLIAAAATGQPEEVRRLLDQGADVNVQSSVLHNRTAMEAAIWHRENDIVRIIAVPGDVPGGGLRNSPLDPDGLVKDEDYREVIGMLRQAIKDEAKGRGKAKGKGKHKVRPSRFGYNLVSWTHCNKTPRGRKSCGRSSITRIICTTF